MSHFSGPSPAAPYGFQHAQAARTARCRGIFARTSARGAHGSFNGFSTKLFSSASAACATTVREARRPAARAPAHEALLRFPVEGLRADEALCPFVSSAHALDRDRDGRRVLLICVVLLGAASFFYFLAELVVPAVFQTWHSGPQ